MEMMDGTIKPWDLAGMEEVTSEHHLGMTLASSMIDPLDIEDGAISFAFQKLQTAYDEFRKAMGEARETIDSLER